MKSTFNYKHENGNTGGIFNTKSRDNSGEWVVSTPTTSRNYKTFKGAEKAINKKGYERV